MKKPIYLSCKSVSLVNCAGEWDAGKLFYVLWKEVGGQFKGLKKLSKCVCIEEFISKGRRTFIEAEWEGGGDNMTSYEAGGWCEWLIT